MKKIFIAVAALILTAALCFASCAMAGKVDDRTPSERERSTRSSGVREDQTTDIEDKMSEGLSKAGEAVRDGVTDVSEAASDVAEDIREGIEKDKTDQTTEKND
ncbi:MAG: hypothetical protein IJS90_07130 [Clostridia bacterium]|nr:hypothetical protein [Clostridia bacterium]